MNVIIKNMRMPKTCGDCRLEYNGFCCASENMVENKDERAKHCPLVEFLPEHGELTNTINLLMQVRDKLLSQNDIMNVSGVSIVIGFLLSEEYHKKLELTDGQTEIR